MLCTDCTIEPNSCLIAMLIAFQKYNISTEKCGDLTVIVQVRTSLKLHKNYINNVYITLG